MTISTRDLTQLPDIPTLRKLCQSLAMLDAIISPDWEYRYYSYNSRWSDGQEMASMRDGSGNAYFCIFNKSGAILKGFDHESLMSPYRTGKPEVWPGVLDNVPGEFTDFLTEPAFAMEDTTFCIWRLNTGAEWQRGNITFPDKPDPDGSKQLLSILDGKPKTYKSWADEYYEDNGPFSAGKIAQIYAHQPLTEKLVRALNEDVSLEELQADIEEIGYPSA